LPVKDPNGRRVLVKNVRYRADGGTFTPPQALELELIDAIGDLQIASEQAAKSAQLSRYKVVTYERPKALLEQLLAIDAKNTGQMITMETAHSALTPRLWYLTAGYEFSGTVAASSLP